MSSLTGDAEAFRWTLPDDLLLPVLSFCEAKCLCVLKRVCRKWFDTLNSALAERLVWEKAFNALFKELMDNLSLHKIRASAKRVVPTLLDSPLAACIFSDGHSDIIRFGDSQRLRFMYATIANPKPDTCNLFEPTRRRRLLKETDTLHKHGLAVVLDTDYGKLQTAVESLELSLGLTSPPMADCSSDSKETWSFSTMDLAMETRSTVLPLLRTHKLGIAYAYAWPRVDSGTGRVDLDQWRLRFVIPECVEQSPYRGATVDATYEIPPEYPFKAPKNFKTIPHIPHLQHCGCGNENCWCIPELRDMWSPAIHVSSFLRLFLKSVAEVPFAEGKYHNDDLAKLLKEDVKLYDKAIRDELKTIGLI